MSRKTRQEDGKHQGKKSGDTKQNYKSIFS